MIFIILHFIFVFTFVQCQQGRRRWHHSHPDFQCLCHGGSPKPSPPPLVPWSQDGITLLTLTQTSIIAQHETIIRHHWPEADKVCVEDGRKEEGENQLPDLSAPLHVTPPDLRQQRLRQRAAPSPPQLQSNITLTEDIHLRIQKFYQSVKPYSWQKGSISTWTPSWLKNSRASAAVAICRHVAPPHTGDFLIRRVKERLSLFW